MSHPTTSVVIADDEPVIRAGIRELLESDARFAVVAECGDGRSALTAIEQHRPRLAMLDIRMPEMNGFEVIDALAPEERPHTVFITAYDEYAVRAFDVHAVDYVLKPFDRERFQEMLRRVQQRLAADPEGTRDAGLDSFIETRGFLDRVAVRLPGRVRLVEIGDVDWFQAAGNYVRVHAFGKAWPVRYTIKGIASRLDPARFIRIHRSTIVNIARIKEIAPLPTGDFNVSLQDGSELTLSRSHKESFQARIGWKL